MNKEDKPLLSIAILGRPNVGKSTLFNRILGKRRAIVHDSPGVTRDWQRYECVFQGLPLEIYDTPGFEKSWEGLSRFDLHGVVWVIDGQQGPTAVDLELAAWLRKQPFPVILAVNKCEKGQTRAEAMAESTKLGFGDPILISALHGHGMGDLVDALKDLIPPVFEEHPSSDEEILSQPEPETQEKLASLPTIVIVGRPNVGKSSLINRCLGFERLRTGPIAGTTRDSIDTLAQWKGRPFRLVDTAGMRKKSAISSTVERLSCQESYRALVFAHVAIVVVDAFEGITKQDLTLIDKTLHEGRALVIALNKWDLVAPRPFAEYEKSLPPLVRRHQPIPVSCRTGQGLSALWDKALAHYESWTRRLPTAALNRWLQEQVAAHPPPLLRSRRIKIKYITQIKSRPPTFGLFGYEVQSLPPEYLRYLEHRLIKDFSFPSLKLVCRNTKNPYD